MAAEEEEEEAWGTAWSAKDAPESAPSAGDATRSGGGGDALRGGERCEVPQGSWEGLLEGMVREEDCARGREESSGGEGREREGRLEGEGGPRAGLLAGGEGPRRGKRGGVDGEEDRGGGERTKASSDEGEPERDTRGRRQGQCVY